VIYAHNFVKIYKSQVKILCCQNWHNMFKDYTLKVIINSGDDVARATLMVM
jgi:hypothetical protein